MQLPYRQDLFPRAARWYPSANMRSFERTLPAEVAMKLRQVGVRHGENEYRYVYDELYADEVNNLNFCLSRYLIIYFLNLVKILNSRFCGGPTERLERRAQPSSVKPCLFLRRTSGSMPPSLRLNYS